MMEHEAGGGRKYIPESERGWIYATGGETTRRPEELGTERLQPTLN